MISLLLFFDDEEYLILIKKEFIWDETWFLLSDEKYNSTQFKNAFRMPKQCLNFIMNKFFDSVNIKSSYNQRKNFIMLLYFASHNITYRDIGEKFGEPTTTAYSKIQATLDLFINNMTNLFIKLPTAMEMEELSIKFFSIKRLRGTILAVDGTHLPIFAPKNHSSQYINRKGFYSVTVQIAADPDYLIRDVHGGLPGGSHDAYLFRRSSFINFVERIPEPYFVIGDAAYPASNSLRTPFRGTRLTEDQERYNNRLAGQRNRVECTIGRIKGRFKRFMSANKHGEKETIMKIFLFACVVHNLIEMYKLDDSDQCYQEYLEEAENEISD
jgi:DDE superfamily endonuclease